MFWNEIMTWESCQRQELLGVDITPVFRLTVQFLNGGLEECLFLSAWKKKINASSQKSLPKTWLLDSKKT